MAEWRIGEIKQVNGEWYQCIKQPEDFIGEVCKICAFQGTENCDVDECSDSFRSDKQDVIFKKLEKVGEPVTVKGRTFQKLTSDNNSCKECVFNVPNKACCKNSYIEGICDINGFWIEIKQNKEDMEIDKVVMNIDDRDYLLDRLEAILHDTHCQQYKDEICEALSKYIVTETAYGLKPFDLNAAKAGKPVCTRDGRKARIICFDMKGEHPIVALIEEYNTEKIGWYYDNGKYLSNGEESPIDLMMLPEKQEGWMYINKISCMLDNKEIAEKNCPAGYVVAKVELEG